MVALPLIPELFKARPNGEPALTRRCMFAAAELALYSGMLTGTLNEGLAEGGSATKAAFLLQAAVIFTPCLSLAVGDVVAGKTWLGAVMALAGVALIALDEVGGLSGALANPELFRLEDADVLFVLSAVAWSLTIFRMGAFARSDELAERVVPIQAAKNVLLGFGFSAWLAFDIYTKGGTLADQWPGADNPRVWICVLLSAVFGGLLGDLLQAVGGKAMPAAEANVILTSEPLWAAGLTALLLNERLGSIVYAGGALLIGAGVVATVGLPPWGAAGARDKAADS
jgi:drug/metabolite transporter (DMT)-like permease